MLNSISTTGMSMPPPRPQAAAASLTEDQTQLINDTLSQYNSENLSSSDAQAIVSIFAEAGIQPGKGLEGIMETAGFDAKTVGDLAGARGPGAGGQNSQSGGIKLTEDTMKELYTLLEQYYADETSSTEKTKLEGAIQDLMGTESSIFSATA
eukprot:GHVR01187453.1.p1 GENE.GHVR01187453.1~~GHVR01187453.1.p1  ORF type:complete len:152 (+),score=20.94 GHVR01187453.1:602-1057(+)